ncbi:MAG: hypothetical protein HY075_08220 [Deltaproteobacteria bacterium]|nr:hypothetical protein [Deltaproteobacteria bacterium]
MKKMLWIAAAMAAVAVAAEAPAQAHAVKGTGLYRTEQDCVRALPAFNRRLERLGLRLTKATECEEVQGEFDAYAPSFEVESDTPMVAETALAGLMPDEKSCNESLRALTRVVADKDEKILEASCVPVTVVDQEEDEMRSGQFQPMVILLKSKQG